MTGLVNIPLGGFRPGDSTLHGLDPRAKLAAGAATLVGVVLAKSWSGVGLLAGLALAATALGGISGRELARDLWSFRLFYLLTFLLHALLDRGGTPAFSLIGIVVTREGLAAGLFFSAKIALLAVLGGALARTTHPAHWSKALEALLPSAGRFGRAFGRPGLVMALALRMLPTILTEAERIRLAQVARGLEIGRGGPLRRVRSLLPLAAPLLSATLRKADTVSAAMISRGFRLDAPRTAHNPLRTKGSDWLSLATAAILAAAAVAL